MATAIVAGEFAESWIGLEKPPAMEERIPSKLIHSNYL